MSRPVIHIGTAKLISLPWLAKRERAYRKIVRLIANPQIPTNNLASINGWDVKKNGAYM